MRLPNAFLETQKIVICDPVYFLNEPERKRFKPVSQRENERGEGASLEIVTRSIKGRFQRRGPAQDEGSYGGAKERQATVTLQYVPADI